jgi:SagB-type dehydrogenase family enzyme
MKYTNSFYEDYISESTRDFLEASKLHYYDIKDYAIQVSSIMNSPYYMKEVFNHSIELGNVKTINLPPSNNEKNSDIDALYRINKERKSIRSFKNEGLNIQELSSFLRNAFFLSKKKEETSNKLEHKNIASPGSLYPIELYYINLKDTEELDIGSYYYDEKNAKLKLVSTLEGENFIQAVYKAFAVEGKMDIDIKSASGIIVLGATLNRLTFKYLDRGVRWAFTEAGAILHNLQLSATANGGIGTCPCAGFFDDFVGELVGHKTCDQTPIISLVVGKI